MASSENHLMDTIVPAATRKTLTKKRVQRLTPGLPKPSTVNSSKRATRPNISPSTAQRGTTLLTLRHRMSTRSRARTFRFMDLPAELRNRIYAFAVTPHSPINLEQLKPPVLAAVSSQLHSEVMPEFAKVVGGKYHTKITTHNRDTFNLTGKLRMSAAPETVIADWITALLFRNFIVSVVCNCPTSRELCRLQVATGEAVSSMDVRRDMKGSEDPDYVGIQFFKNVSTEMLGSAIAAIRGIKAKQGFSGFSLHDLRTIAETFGNHPGESGQASAVVTRL